jgi:hypothetical protein
MSPSGVRDPTQLLTGVWSPLKSAFGLLSTLRTYALYPPVRLAIFVNVQKMDS